MQIPHTARCQATSPHRQPLGGHSVTDTPKPFSTTVLGLQALIHAMHVLTCTQVQNLAEHKLS